MKGRIFELSIWHQFSGVKVVVQRRAKKLSTTGVTVHLGNASRSSSVI
jgi:hypothetical protein